MTKSGGGARLLLGALAVGGFAIGGCSDMHELAERSLNSAPSTDEATVESASAEFTDPEETYTITVGPDWEENSGGVVKEVEAWLVGPPDDGFVPNVNVLTQLAPGMDLAQYLDFSLENMGGMNVLEHDTVDVGGGAEVGLLEYEGDLVAASGGQPLHFLASVVVKDGQAVVATFTATESSFADLRSDVEPYLLTLRAT